MPASTLFPGEKVYDETNIHELLGAHRPGHMYPSVEVNGEHRIMARLPKPPGYDTSGFASPFSSSGLSLISDSDVDAVIDEQIERKALVSDHVDFEPFDQDGLPTCWAIGMAQAFSIKRRCMGLPHKQMSGCSLATPISGGHSGGYEGDSLRYSAEHGICDTDVWPENNTSRSLIDDPKVAENRKLHRSLKFLEMNNAQEWRATLLRGHPGPFAYNRMSHVMCMCDYVRIEAGRYGFRCRNSWGKWGAANRLGFYGFAVYTWVPDSGFSLFDITASEK